MGRFDLLTQLEKKTVPSPPPFRNEVTPIPEHQFASKLAKKQTSKEVRKQTSKLADLQTSKEVNQQGSKLLKKFGSYLPPETIKALKRYAFDNEREIYDVLKEAIDLYLEQKT